MYLYVEYRLNDVPNSYNQKRKNFESQLTKIQVLQLGPSHALYGVDPGCFSYHGFNLANNSQSFYYDTKLSLKYIDKMTSLKIVIISVGYQSFRFQLRNSIENWRENFYYSFWHIDDPYLPFFRVEKISKFFMYKVPKVRYLMLHHFQDRINDVYIDSNGFSPLPVTCTDANSATCDINDSAARKRIKFLNSEMSKNYIAENLNYLKSFLDIVKAKHIKLVFITCPVYTLLREYQDTMVLKENDSLVHMLCNLYGGVYFNYSSDPRFNIQDFNDADHLNYVGAGKFSKIIDSEILRPAISKMQVHLLPGTPVK
jgi:hypothetical protein